jgi:DNA processing protein
LTQLKVDAPMHLDTIVENLEETPPSEIIAALFELEMLGLARQLPGRNFVRIW